GHPRHARADGVDRRVGGRFEQHADAHDPSLIFNSPQRHSMIITRTTVLAVVGLVAAAHVANAQDVPIRQLAAVTASRDTVGYLYGLRELSDGRVLVNDAGNRRLLMFDATLARFTIVADSSTGRPGVASYGKRPTGIIPYAGDSTLLIDQA